MQANTSSSFSQDIQLAPGPTDTVTEIAVCPVADFIAISSWDNQVYDYLL